jgi:putative LysE/RhtB family amino acid efflux pump
MLVALLAGLGLGFAVGAQVGPIWLLCVRSSLRHGFASGLAIGAGAALVDGLYAALGVAGATTLLQLAPLRVALGLLGAGVLAAIGLRTLWSALRVRLGAELPEEVASPRRAFATSLAATASNPLTIVSWAAIFSAASTAHLAAGSAGAAALVAGVAAGSMAWFAILAGGVSLARRRTGARTLRLVDVVSGAGLTAFAGVLVWRTLDGDA